MGRLHLYNDALNESQTDEQFTIRVPLKMIQLTEKNGAAYPIAFDWENEDGSVNRVKINGVVTVMPSAERKSGAVGDRYECEIEGRIEYLYYSKLPPRKWFLIQKVSEKEYNEYYKLPGESPEKNPGQR